MFSHLLKIFVLVFAALCATAGVIFIFTSEPGIKGYCSVLLAVCGVATLLGAILVYAARDSRGATIELTGRVSDDVLREMQQDAERGSALGLELFYSALGSFALVYAVSHYL